MAKIAVWGLVAALGATQVVAQEASPTPERSAQLVRMVRQDCGSCHGMRLTGGLGPSLAREALAGKNTEYLAAVITHGIANTPMPAWSALLAPSEAQWIAQQLLQGFPEEPRNSAP